MDLVYDGMDLFIGSQAGDPQGVSQKKNRQRKYICFKQVVFGSTRNH